MRKAVTAIAAMVFVAGVAGAQMKPKPAATPQPRTNGGNPLVVAGAQKSAPENVRKIEIDEALKLFRKGEAVMVDVRSHQQFSLGHINGAVSIPGSQLISRFSELPPGKLIITYCACTAEQSSGRAVVELNAHGVKNAAALKGGWAAWKAAGYPIAAGPK